MVKIISKTEVAQVMEMVREAGFLDACIVNAKDWRSLKNFEAEAKANLRYLNKKLQQLGFTQQELTASLQVNVPTDAYLQFAQSRLKHCLANANSLTALAQMPK